MRKLNKKALGMMGWAALVIGLLVLLTMPSIVSKLNAAMKRFDVPLVGVQQDNAEYQEAVKLHEEARALYAQGDFSTAATKFRLVIEKDKSKTLIANSLFEIARSFYETDDLDTAISYYEKYINAQDYKHQNKKPTDPLSFINHAYSNLVDIYLHKFADATVSVETGVRDGFASKAVALVANYEKLYGRNSHYNLLSNKLKSQDIFE